MPDPPSSFAPKLAKDGPYFLQVRMSIIPLKKIEDGFGYIIVRSSYTPYSIYRRGTIQVAGLGFRI